jgi:hypothetical protein
MRITSWIHKESNTQWRYDIYIYSFPTTTMVICGVSILRYVLHWLTFGEINRKMYSQYYFLQVRPNPCERQHKDVMFHQILKYRYNDYRIFYISIEILMTHGFQRTGLTASQFLPEREDHVMGVEGAAYKVRYRPVQANCTRLSLF